jgi:signal transduction histidine kinase
LKIIPPIIAIAVSAGYAIHYFPAAAISTLTTAGLQLFNIILIIYCEDKVKWKLMWANIQKEKWMQVNDFILNSIPENIIMLDLHGETKFISEYCKLFMEKCDLSLETKDFFKKIQDLKQQQYEPPSALQMERMTTINLPLLDSAKVTLEEVVTRFKEIIMHKEIQERQFLIYNGKLQIENHPAKSLEIKISFVQHFEDSYIILMLRDTTQRDLLITLEETNKYKDQLLASVSHELRAPLNGTINMVEGAVQSKYVSEHIKETLLIPALRSSKFLLHIINDVLDMSQIKEKKLRLVFQSGNLRETLRSAAQLVEIQAKKKGIQLFVEIESNIPQKLCTDHIRLSQIVLNLLNNGIKFTKEGIVKLTAQAISGSSSVRITVEDSGIGMFPENLQKLFTAYTHIEFEERQSMNPTGAGLGLNIAHNLALLLGPKDHSGITAKSISGQGSTFTFILENHQEEPDDSGELLDETPEQLVQFMPSARLHGSRINSSSTAPLMGRSESFSLLSSFCSCPQVMIVDDNPFNTMAFETILGSLEIKCDCVYSGSACIKSLLNRQTKPCSENCKQYGVIFMDQEMPEMSGTETAHEILKLQNENLLAQGIMIIGCTAHKSKEEVKKFMEAGIDQCIHKPISAVMIKEILKGIVFDQ